MAMAVSLKPLDQQVIVLTGASSGIGLATAEPAAREGAKAVLSARSERAVQGLADRIAQAGGEALVVSADVGDRSEVERVAAAAIERFGRIHCWINNAGVSIYGRLDEVTEEDSSRLF